MNTGVPPTVSPAASPASVVETAVQGAVQKIQGRREQLREQTDRKIMRATLEIMISKGVAAVTIEEVARRSGVAKTTIYRRYKTPMTCCNAFSWKLRDCRISAICSRLVPACRPCWNVSRTASTARLV